MFHNGVNYDPRNVAIIRSDNIYSMVLIKALVQKTFFIATSNVKIRIEYITSMDKVM